MESYTATDHRTRVGQRKSAAMRNRILTATMAVFADRTHAAPSIELIVKEAEVSRGTFYKHFSTLDEALVAVATLLTDEMTIGILPVYDVVQDPTCRVSTGMRLFLTRAMMDKTWAGFVSRAELLPQQSLLVEYLQGDLRKGALDGKFEFESLTAATDLVMGVTLEAMRGVVLGRINEPRIYIDVLITLVLRGFGVSKADTKAAVNFSREHLASFSPEAAGNWTANITALERLHPS